MFAGTLWTGGNAFLTAAPFLVWLPIRPKVPWLQALPIPKGRLLCSILLPPMLALSGGYLISVHRSTYTNTVERGILVRASQADFYGSPTEITPHCKTMNILPAEEFWVPAKQHAVF